MSGHASHGAPATRPPEASGVAGGPVAVAAIDLGATSGRVMLGVVRAGRIGRVQGRRLDSVRAESDGHVAWDIDALWAEIQQGLAEAHELAIGRGLTGLSSIGVDSWAVDYVLVGADDTGADGQPLLGSGARVGEAMAYRESRTDGVDDQVAGVVSRSRQFAVAGIDQQPCTSI